MSVPPFFSKFDKASSDFFSTDDFDLGKKFVIKAKLLNGDKMTATASAIGNGSQTLKWQGNRSVGELEAEVNTENLITGKFKSNELMSGLKVELKGKSDRVKGALKCNLSSEFMYTVAPAALTAKVNFKNSQDEKVLTDVDFAGSIASTYKGLIFGADFAHNGKSLSAYNAGVFKHAKGVSYGAKTADKFNNVIFSLHQQILPKVAFGASLSVGAKKDSQDMFRHAKFGVEHKLSDVATARAVFTKDCCGNTASLMYSCSIIPAAKISIGSVIGLGDKSGVQSAGFKFEMGDL